MKHNVEISVIVPVYNAEKHLDLCICSILAQDFGSFELVLVNDGSIDGSAKILDKYKEHKNVKIIEQKKHGVSAARNAGIQASSGRYVMFVDADDTIDKMMLSEMYRIATGGDFDLVISDVENKHADEHVCNGDLLSFLLYNELWSPCAKLIKRDTIKIGFDPKIAIAEDLLFCYQNAANWTTFAYMPKRMYHYRNNESSAMRRNLVSRADLTVFDVLDVIINDKSLDEELRVFLKAYYVKTYYFIFSKEVKDSRIVQDKVVLGRVASRYYKDVKKQGKISAKLFVQATFTPVYNLLRKSVLSRDRKKQK